MEKSYKDFGLWIKEIIGQKVQKISIDAGFSCPNRDGRVGWGGCTFCDNTTFSPAYCSGEKTVTEQLSEGKAFFKRKYPEMKYLAYFQSYSNTYGSLSHLKSIYEEALADGDVVGIVIGTRPDCVSDELLDYLGQLAKRTFVLVEYGVESVNDDVLKRVNRGHDFQCALDAIRETSKRGIHVGAHIILGLPGEDDEENIRGIRQLHDSGMKLLKLHQLQIIRGTQMAAEYAENPFPLYSADEYIRAIIRYISELPDDIVYDRFVSQSPPGKVLAPSWGLKNHEFVDKLRKALRSNDLH
ncbi:MAG: TIGR01212 family radical SAM protein [Bacteroidaceae bacterium]|nr:TIGR01212 family radical SAM protein [Bacteroidaceae bacterium]